MAETYFDAIRNFSMDDMALFLRDATYFDLVPKKYSCDATDCFECKEDLYCFKHWLRREVKYGSK